MKIGFTGTRKGMTDIQKKTFIHEFTGYKNLNKLITEFHDGNCKGADIEARTIIAKHSKKPLVFHIHPSVLNPDVTIPDTTIDWEIRTTKIHQ